MIIYNEIIPQFLTLQSSLFHVEGAIAIQIFFLRYKTLHKIKKKLIKKKNKKLISPAK